MDLPPIRVLLVLGITAMLAAGAAAPTVAAPRRAATSAPQQPGSRLTFEWVDPVQAPPAVNRRHAGTWIRVTFSLGGDFGTDILRDGWPKSRRVDCQSGDAVPGTLASTNLPSPEGLRYDAGNDTYHYAWRAPRSYATGGRCRDLLLKLDDGSVHAAHFRFGDQPADEPPAGEDCADVIDGTGQYISKDPVTGDPLPEPRADFVIELGDESCAPTGGGVETIYSLLVFEGVEGEAKPGWPLRIADDFAAGDGTSTFVTFSVPIEGNAPDAICALAYVRRRGAVLERAPDWPFFSCAYVLDEGPPGRSGFD